MLVIFAKLNNHLFKNFVVKIKSSVKEMLKYEIISQIKLKFIGHLDPKTKRCTEMFLQQHKINNINILISYIFNTVSCNIADSNYYRELLGLI